MNVAQPVRSSERASSGLQRIDLDRYSVKSSRNTVILLVYSFMRAGGIESLIIRLMGWLSARNQQVLLLLTNPERNEIFSGDPIPFIPLFGDDLSLSDALIERIATMVDHEFIVFSFDSGSAAAASILERYFFLKRIMHVHISGVFHPRAYFMDAEPKSRKTINWLIGNSFPESLLIFMNQETLVSHSAFFKRRLRSSLIAHLPLSEPEVQKFTQDIDKLRILTVGRLVDFKAYNLGVVHNAKALRSAGIDFRWEIFGDGPLRQVMEAQIFAEGLQERVFLRGTIKYDSLPWKMVESDLFVGHGTSALEAAQHGLPAICCTVDSRLTSYGFIHDLPPGNVGEVLPGREGLAVSDLIASFASLEPKDRRDLSIKSIHYAQQFSFDAFVFKLVKIDRNSDRKPGLSVRAAIGHFLINLHARGNGSLKSLVRYHFDRLFS
jgi:hypothetical protein